MRKTFLLLLLCLQIIYSSAQTHFNPQQKEVYNTIVAIGKAWANNDLSTLEQLISADYVHTDIYGNALQRRQWLDYVKEKKKAGIINSVMDFEDVTINIYGNTALVTGGNIINGQFGLGDNNHQAQKIRFTQVLMKDRGVWKRKLFQATMLNQSSMNNTDSIKKKLEQLSISWMDAWLHNDVSYLEKILAPEFRLLTTINGKPSIVSRQQWLSMLPIYIAQSFHYYDFDIRVYDKIALIQSKNDIKATLNGQDRSGTFQLTDIWKKNDKEEWQVIHRHSTYYPLH